MKKKLILFLIILLGFVLRICNVSSIPPGINRDEAAIGYNAYSILKTGRDEYGKFLPLSFKSFGDWKLPLYIYLDIIPIKLLSLNELSVRLPSVILGTSTILILYFIVGEIILDKNRSNFFSLLATLFLAISPWHIHFSRVASEANVSLFLTTLSILIFIKNREKQTSYYFLSSLLLGLSLYTYHANHIFAPLLFLGLSVILFLKRIETRKILFFLCPFIFLCLIIFQQTLFSADITKFSGLSPLADQYLVYENIILPRVDHSNSILARAYHNKLFFLTEKFLEGYWRSFSTEFLFIKGGANLQHNIPNFGNFYLWDTLFFIIGLYFLFHHTYKWKWLLLYWILISPLPAAITKDAPHSARMLSLLPTPYILSSIGFGEFYFVLIRNFNRIRIAVLIFVFLLLINFSIFLDRYFTHFPKTNAAFWGGGLKELVNTVSLLQGSYEEVIIDRPNYSPYIYFLFYQKVDPSLYQKEVIRYPEDKEGFVHVKQFEKIYFKNLDWSADLFSSNKLIVSWSDTTPASTTQNALIKRIITLNNGQSQFYLISK